MSTVNFDAGERLIQYFKTFRCSSLDNPYTGDQIQALLPKRKRGGTPKNTEPVKCARDFLYNLFILPDSTLDTKCMSLWSTIMQNKSFLIEACYIKTEKKTPIDSCGDPIQWYVCIQDEMQATKEALDNIRNFCKQLDDKDMTSSSHRPPLSGNKRNNSSSSSSSSSTSSSSNSKRNTRRSISSPHCQSTNSNSVPTTPNDCCSTCSNCSSGHINTSTSGVTNNVMQQEDNNMIVNDTPERTPNELSRKQSALMCNTCGDRDNFTEIETTSLISFLCQ